LVHGYPRNDLTAFSAVQEQLSPWLMVADMVSLVAMVSIPLPKAS